MQTDELPGFLTAHTAHIWGPGGCPASPRLARHYSNVEKGEAEREGEAAKWVFLQATRGEKPSLGDFAPNGMLVSQEMLDSVEEVVEDVLDTFGAHPANSLHVELAVEAPSLVHPNYRGTVDVAVVNAETRSIHVWLFKYGRSFVDAFKNWAGVSYVAGIIEKAELPIHQEADFYDWSFSITVAQPRSFQRDELGGSLRQWYASGDAVLNALAELRIAATRTEEDAPPCNTGKHCRGCKVIWDCAANQAVGGVVIDVTQPSGTINSDPHSLAIEAKVLAEAIERGKDRLAAIEPQVEAMLRKGTSLPFHTLAPTKGRDKWRTGHVATIANICAMYGLEIERGVALPTPKQLVKKGIDEAVITPYFDKGRDGLKLERVEDNSVSKILGVRK